MRARRHVLALTSLLACQPSQGEAGSFTTVQPSTTAPASTGDGSTSASPATTGVGSSSLTSTGDVSTGGPDTGTSSVGSTTLLLDVGTDKDVGDNKPPGCQGKIDFLFVVARDGKMKLVQDKLIAAFPKFIETIEAKFADFDFHIMVVDGDKHWGHTPCNEECTPQGCPYIQDYPCDLIDQVTTCDKTIGAGSVFAAGGYATNTPCSIAGGRRYLTKDQPNLAETFACVARLGISGFDLLGEALVAAMHPTINAPGGCNAGFLRDDALLMVTFIGSYDQTKSEGDPNTWRDWVLAAKGDPSAVVMLNIYDPACPYYDRICELVQMFPYHHVADFLKDDYGAAFDEATDLVEVACSEFIPG
ncbi:MAG TPA: hypothetical protein PKW35_13565 [Nannocystaceae bacterium]|nr:hypothetical protein [Nannocystaceae bacterium]